MSNDIPSEAGQSRSSALVGKIQTILDKIEITQNNLVQERGSLVSKLDEICKDHQEEEQEDGGSLSTEGRGYGCGVPSATGPYFGHCFDVDGTKKQGFDPPPVHPAMARLAKIFPIYNPAMLLKADNNWRPAELKKLEQTVAAVLEEYGRLDDSVAWGTVQTRMNQAFPNLPDRSCSAYRLKWKNDLSLKSTRKDSWTKEEERRLLILVIKYKEHHWEQIAMELNSPGKGPLQCLRHYQRSLNPRITRKEWTAKEELKLMELVEIYGKKWTRVAAEMDGRKSEQCRQRWRILSQYESITKNGSPKNARGAKRGREGITKWTADEERRLCLAVRACGTKWIEVAQFLPGRTDQQCREKWIYVLNPDQKKGKWTPEEDLKLQRVIEEEGVGQWKKVADRMEGRSGHQCKVRWSYFQEENWKEYAMATKRRRMNVPATLRRSARPSLLSGEDFAMSVKSHQKKQTET
mmetsp:Transcript_17353/g.22860  ORF Transcript_17353/g.22860 Transcript_17353/m.22860 type:complete len:464 (+) Transcript_17353:274-1665(+)